MAPFNPPRKQATAALANATRALAMNAHSEVRQHRPIKPGHRPLRKRDIGQHSQANRNVSFLHQILDVIGIEGRKVLARRSTPMDDICSVELTSNTGEHWSIVYRFMVFHLSSALVGAVAIHHFNGKMEVDFYIDEEPWVEPAPVQTPSKNLTVKQLEAGYLKYLRLSSLFLKFRHTVWNSSNDVSSVVCVLGALDIKSLEALIAKANAGAEDYSGPQPQPRFILHVNEDEIVSRPGVDDVSAWDLVDMGGPGYIRLYRNQPSPSTFDASARIRLQAEGHLRFGEILMQIANQEETR